ncbi:MAG: hypothetical protein EXX96DRAFT_473877 [Benjaminiella poitrasii]|nr:MAG: hypothetical protein EXX96DRAFT_473877 [Benjaminiella poitrasii]
MYLPKKYGGLTILEPESQHLVLQKRWVNYLFDTKQYPSFVYPHVLQHLSFFSNSSSFPLLPVLLPSYRTSPAYDRSLSIWTSIFQLVDYFLPQASHPIVGPLPLSTLLELPLYLGLSNIDNTHWSKRHPKFLISHMFIFDSQQQRLRLRVDGEYPRYPRLCRTLYNDILTHRSIGIHDFVWDHILHPPPSTNTVYAISRHPAINQITVTSTWSSFSATQLRFSRQDASISAHRFRPSIVRRFWSSPQYPNARTVYFRTIHGRIPTQIFLNKFQPEVPLVCTMCGQSNDTIRHFLVDCPKKWIVWQTVLSHYFASDIISPELVYGALRYLHLPEFITNQHAFFTIISTIHWQLWNAYWRHGNTNPQPISLSTIEHISTQSFSLLHTLLTHG